MQGKLAATAVNAPMVPAEILAELQPFVALAQGLGRSAVQLVAEQGFSDVRITYYSPRGDDLDTRSMPPSPFLKLLLGRVQESDGTPLTFLRRACWPQTFQNHTTGREASGALLIVFWNLKFQAYPRRT